VKTTWTKPEWTVLICIDKSSCFVQAGFTPLSPPKPEPSCPQAAAGELSAEASPLLNGHSEECGIYAHDFTGPTNFRPERHIMLSMTSRQAWFSPAAHEYTMPQKTMFVLHTGDSRPTPERCCAEDFFESCPCSLSKRSHAFRSE
jgi:hypothetical protein